MLPHCNTVRRPANDAAPVGPGARDVLAAAGRRLEEPWEGQSSLACMWLQAGIPCAILTLWDLEYKSAVPIIRPLYKALEKPDDPNPNSSICSTRNGSVDEVRPTRPGLLGVAA